MENGNFNKLLKTDNKDNALQKYKGSELEKKKRRIKGICASLNRGSEKYKTQMTIDSIEKYVGQESHILYSEISIYVFSLREEQRGDFLANVDKLLVESMTNDELGKEVKEAVLKIYDHVQLAICQLESLKRNDGDLKNIIGENLEPVKNQFQKELEKGYKEIYSQLIGLIGIFTALAFLIFGSISALDNIFSNANEMSIFKVVIIAAIWGICITNLIYIFIHYVSELTGLTRKVKGRYIIVAWSNLLLMLVLIVCSWSYYIRKMKLVSWLERFETDNAKWIVIIGFLSILLVFSVLAILIFLLSKKREAK